MHRPTVLAFVALAAVVSATLFFLHQGATSSTTSTTGFRTSSLDLALINCSYFKPGTPVPNTVCLGCFFGYFVNANGSACLPCPAGSYSMNGVTCDLCSVGTFSTEIAVALFPGTCKNCPAGTSSPVVGSDSNKTCEPCYPLLSSAGSGFCGTCSTVIPGCIECQSSTVCSACAAGYKLNVATGTCQVCNGGFYNPQANATACLACPSGTYSDAGLASSSGLPFARCTSCPNGTVPSTTAPKSSIAYCYPAVGGMPVGCLYVSPIKLTTCVSCESGFLLINGACVACSSAPGGALGGCQQCEPSGLKVGERPYTCNVCDPNTGAILQPVNPPPVLTGSQTDPNVCCLENCALQNRVTCSPGNSGVCGGCTIGYYLGANNVTGSACMPCPANTYNPNTAQNLVSSCTPCPVNTASLPGSTSLAQCVASL